MRSSHRDKHQRAGALPQAREQPGFEKLDEQRNLDARGIDQRFAQVNEYVPRARIFAFEVPAQQHVNLCEGNFLSGDHVGNIRFDLRFNL